MSREKEQWLLYRESDTGIRARIFDVVIPPDLDESELADYLADIYHEHAMGTSTEVKRLN